MIEERLKNAMQNKLPEAPEALNARIDQQIIRLSDGHKKEMKHTHTPRAVLIIMLVLVLLLGTFTAFAATNERLNAWLYEFWPEAAITLMPSGTVYENAGIRLELVSASFDHGMLTVTFSLEDLEEDRISENTVADVTMEWESVKTRYDAIQKKLFLTWTTEYEEHEKENEGDYELEIALLHNRKNLTVDLLPLLREYGNQARTISIRKEDIDPDNPISENELVLDYINGLDVPLSDYVMLSGIGITDDGVLRVQFHYPVHHVEYVRIYKENDPRYESLESPYRIYLYSPYDCWAYLYDSDETDLENLPSMKKYGYSTPLVWGSHDEMSEFPEYQGKLSTPEWAEFRFRDLPAELTEAQTLIAEIQEEDPPIIGLWTIKIPKRYIKNAIKTEYDSD